MNLIIMPNKRMLYLIPMLFLQVLCHHPSPAIINLLSAIGNYNINHVDPVSLQSSHSDLFILFLQYTLIRCKRHIVLYFFTLSTSTPISTPSTTIAYAAIVDISFDPSLLFEQGSSITKHYYCIVYSTCRLAKDIRCLMPAESVAA